MAGSEISDGGGVGDADEGADWGAGSQAVAATSFRGKVVVDPGAGILVPSLVVQIHPG